MNPEQEDRQARLLRHLPGIFTAAQLLSANADRAADLVVSMYRRALAAPDEPMTAEQPMTPEQEKAWLYRSLTRTHDLVTGAAQAGPPDTEEGDEARAAADRFALERTRRQLAEAFVETALPKAFMVLSREERMLLYLCEVEAVPCAVAADVLGLAPDDACARLAEARTALLNGLHAQANPIERHLLDRAYPHVRDTLGPTLGRTLRNTLPPIPPTLRPKLGSAPAAPALPALPPPPPPPRREKPRRRLSNFFGALALIAMAGLIGFTIASLFEPAPPEVNLIALSAEGAETVRPTFRTISPEQAERFVQDRLGGWRLTLPGINEAMLVGVGIREITPGLEVPAFLFEEADGASLVLYAYTYALLEQHREHIALDRDILRQIERDRHFDIHDLGPKKVLVWRYRDDIFVAITTGDPEALRSRIFFPS